MSSCSIPGFPPTFSLAADEMEVGLGIHGEKGKGREKVMSCDEIAEKILQKFDPFLNKLGDNKKLKVFVLFNNLGACTDIEMAIFARAVFLRLQNKNNVIILRAA